MKGLLRVEMRRALTNRWFAFSLVVLTALAVASAIPRILYVTSNLDVVVYPYLDTSYWYVSAYSSYRSWIAVNRMATPIEAFFILVPLLVLMGYSWSVASDHRSGYAEHLLARSSKSSWYSARYAAVFVSGGLLVALPMLVNFLLLALFTPSWQPSVVDMTYMGVSSAENRADDALFTDTLFVNAPLYVAARTALDFALCGAWCVSVLAVSLFVRNRVALIAVPYLALLLVKHLGQRLYVVMRTNGADGFGRSFTLFDQLRASPDGFYCPGWLTLACLAAMLAFSIVVPCLSRRRDVL